MYMVKMVINQGVWLVKIVVGVKRNMGMRVMKVKMLDIKGYVLVGWSIMG